MPHVLLPFTSNTSIIIITSKSNRRYLVHYVKNTCTLPIRMQRNNY